MAKKLTFEARLKRLEEIVQGLETSGLSLEEAVERFGEGMTLAKELEEHLAAMEKKIEELTANGQVAPADPSLGAEDEEES
jgi:exodeoxyribonuclease VII small subunit